MLTALVLAALTAPATGLPTIQYDSPAPNFAIPSARGTRYLSDLRGKTVVIDFWASWCHVCTAELSDFVRARQTYGGDRVVVVTISDEPHDIAAGYLRQANIDLPVIEDPDGVIHRVYSVPKIPVTLVLDPAGKVSYVSVGGESWEELSTAIERAQAGSAASTLGAGVLQ
jgi:peroxiredoxin